MSRAKEFVKRAGFIAATPIYSKFHKYPKQMPTPAVMRYLAFPPLSWDNVHRGMIEKVKELCLIVNIEPDSIGNMFLAGCT